MRSALVEARPGEVRPRRGEVRSRRGRPRRGCGPPWRETAPGEVSAPAVRAGPALKAALDGEPKLTPMARQRITFDGDRMSPEEHPSKRRLIGNCLAPGWLSSFEPLLSLQWWAGGGGGWGRGGEVSAHGLHTGLRSPGISRLGQLTKRRHGPVKGRWTWWRLVEALTR